MTLNPILSVPYSADATFAWIELQVKIIFAIFLICETTDFTAEPRVDEEKKKSLAKAVSAERRLKQAQGEEKGKIDAWRKLQNARNEVEVAKTMYRPRRYVSSTKSPLIVGQLNV